MAAFTLTSTLSSSLLLCILVTSLWQMTLTQTLQNVVDLRLFTVDNATNYNKNMRPVASQSSSQYVEMQFKLRGMGGLDEKAQTMETVVELAFFWKNEFLVWTPADYGGVYSMEIIQNEVWVPDIIVGNSAAEYSLFGHKNLATYQRSCGRANWVVRTKIVSNCDIDISFYPFDTQKCDIEFIPEFNYPNEQKIYIYNSFYSGYTYQAGGLVDLSELDKDGTWTIVATGAFDEYESDSVKQVLKYTFVLQRKTTYFILSLILPVFFLSFTATLVFALPVDAGEKMGTSITVLLAYAVYLTIVTDYLPDTSLHVSMLSLYLTMLLGLCTVCVIFTTFIIRINFKPETDKRGKKTRKFTLFAKKRNYSLNVFSLIRDECKNTKVNPEHSADSYERDHTISQIAPMETKMGASRSVSAAANAPTEQVDDEVEWPDVARALDWAACIVTTSFNLLTTFVFFLVMIIGSNTNLPTLDPVEVTNVIDFSTLSPWSTFYSGC